MSDKVICDTCHLVIVGWAEGPANHCEATMAGGATMRGAHHTREPLHKPCWRCGAHLGCKVCSGDGGDVCCKTCRIFQSAEALIKNGLHPGVVLGLHPPEWVEAYNFTHPPEPPRKAGWLLEMLDQELEKRFAARGQRYVRPSEKLTDRVMARTESEVRARLGLRDPGDD